MTLAQRIKLFVDNGLNALNIATNDKLIANAAADSANAESDAATATLLASVAAATSLLSASVASIQGQLDNMPSDSEDHEQLIEDVANLKAQLDDLNEAFPDVEQNPDVSLPEEGEEPPTDPTPTDPTPTDPTPTED